MTLNVTPHTIPLNVRDSTVRAELGIGGSYPIRNIPHYEGETTFTPTQNTQTVQTVGMMMDSNITINPIPENYGLITWDGSVLTVS